MVIVVFLCVLSSLLVWQFVGYSLLMGIVALRAKPKFKDRTYAPFVSIVVPAYNEEQVIKKRVENLDSLDYPKEKYEIIVVESGSTDATAQIVEEQIAGRGHGEPRLKLVREGERRGKASAINAGKECASGEIILVTDANASFDRDVLREIAPHFADPKVGAVCQLTDVNVPLVFGQNVPGVFGKNAPLVFGQNAPRLFGQIVPPVHKSGARLKGSDSRLLLIQ
jgi:biofilm PGA synthesis N-glycosyltransferase PgaC